MDLVAYKVYEFDDMTASAAPVPGGGGISAIAGSLGMALGSMAVNITGKKGLPEELAPKLKLAEELRTRLLACVDADAKVFEPLAKAYRLIAEDPDMDDYLEECLHYACSVPLEIFDLTCEAIRLLEELLPLCKASVISDIGTGAALCRAALQGAAMNVRVNTHLMKEERFIRMLDEHVDRLLPEYAAAADRIYETVTARLMG